MPSAPNPDADKLTLPLHTEETAVTRRQVIEDTVRVSTVAREVEQPVDELLTHERVEVERVPIGRQIAQAPPVREEGHTVIIPVVEEMLVVERRLILKEEVRIRRVRVTEHYHETIMVRDQDITVTHLGTADNRQSDETDLNKLTQEQPT